MIVEFADRRRRSDASSGSNAVRNSRLRRLSRSSGSGRGLIVSFAELRRRSSAAEDDAPPRSAAAAARGHGRPERRPSTGDSQSSRGPAAVAPSSSPRRTPGRRAPRDPVGVSWRSMISMSGRSLVDDEGADRPSKPDPEERGVIVEFPKKERRRSGRDPAPRGGELSLSGIFRRKQRQQQQSRPSEEQPPREPSKYELQQQLQQQQQGQEEQRPRPSGQPTRPKTRRERRRYSGAIDWRETSIDWGDEEDDQGLEETSPCCASSSSSSSHRDSFVPDKVGRRPSNPARRQRKGNGSVKFDSSTSTRGTVDTSDSQNASGNSLSRSWTSLMGMRGSSTDS